MKFKHNDYSLWFRFFTTVGSRQEGNEIRHFADKLETWRDQFPSADSGQMMHYALGLMDAEFPGTTPEERLSMLKLRFKILRATSWIHSSHAAWAVRWIDSSKTPEVT